MCIKSVYINIFIIKQIQIKLYKNKKICLFKNIFKLNINNFLIIHYQTDLFFKKSLNLNSVLTNFILLSLLLFSSNESSFSYLIFSS